jgi:hypothetical protein
MIRKRTNPQMPPQTLTRQDPNPKLVEGEDFRIKCPDWCVPMQEAAWPEEVGWYLAVWLFNMDGLDDDDQGPQPEFVYLEHNTYTKGDPWVVYELGSRDPAPRSEYWWVGRVKMPELVRVQA